MLENSYQTKLKLSNSHVDQDAKMKELAIVNALQDIEGLHIKDLKEFTKYLEDNNLGVFLLYRQIDILKKPNFGETITLTTFPYQTNSISGYRHIYLYDENNDLAVTTNSFGAFINLDTYVPARIPRSIVKTIVDGQQSELMECLARKIDVNEEDIELLEEFKIKRSHIDRYRHVNNAFYIQFALDAFDTELEYNRIRAEYVNSFQLGDTVKIYLNKDLNDLKTVILKDQDENISAIIEFSSFNS